MNKIYSSFLILSLAFTTVNAQSQLTGLEAHNICTGSTLVIYNGISKVPASISFGEASALKFENVLSTLAPVLQMREEDELKLYRTEKDKLGFTHYRYQQYYNGVPVKGGEYFVHVKDGFVRSVNGSWLSQMNLNSVAGINEQTAIASALNYLKATRYKWEMPQEEARIKQVTKDPAATFYPKAELVIVPKDFNYKKPELHLTYKFDIYADAPLSRNYFYVDASTGEIIAREDRICHTDVNCTATTMYAGTQPLVADFVSVNNYRLRETGRGQGVETYNLNHGSNYGNATDFTSTTTLFNTTTNQDNAAYDAHWGAEGTYDYYVLIHNRNGLDDLGMRMLSYVHYNTGYNNAFWDGTEMTYGDGSGTPGNFNPLTAIDVCGHEFTHGVTEFSANLVYSYESGALNESFSDIMGTNIEFYKEPSLANFLIGDQIMVTPGTALRSMVNPNQYGDPDTYTGTNWYTGTGDNGGVHTNSGVQNFWYYLLCQGGTGTNDLSQAYSVTGIGRLKAEQIVFRNLTVYLSTNSQYIDARNGSIQAAQDLYGPCSPEVIATTNAWHAVGVGPVFSSVVNAAFTANSTTSCSVPFTVNFTNTSTNSSTASWTFGDNTSSTVLNPSHTYTTAGTFTVKLYVGGACGTDSVVQTSFITVNPPAAPTTTGAVSCTPSTLNLSASGTPTLTWFTVPTGGLPINTGGTYTTPLLSSTTTYYVQTNVAGPSGNVGPANNTIGTGGNHNSTTTRYQIFNVTQPCTLVSVYVYSSVAGNRTINLWDNAGNVLQTWTINIPNGNSTVTLNAPLTPGTGYRLGGTSMNLYRNSAGAVYPYNYTGYVSITGNNNSTTSFYFFYNWVINAAPCTSVRTPVVAQIGPLNPVTYSAAPYDTLCINWSPVTLTGGSPSSGTYSGTGVSGGIFSPSVSGAGNFVVTYSFTDINGCIGTAQQTIHVDVCTGINSATVQTGLSIYPNPSNGNISLEVGLAQNEHASLNVMNSLGQIIVSQEHDLQSGNNKLSLDLSAQAKGIYFIQIKTSTDVVTKKVTLN